MAALMPMPKPICIPCQRFFKPKRIGAIVLEQMPLHNDAAPGAINGAAWRPHRIWSADVLACRGCGAEILSGFGRAPIAEHYQAEFADMLARVTHTVNDC
jgi:hypothetical protein